MLRLKWDEDVDTEFKNIFYSTNKDKKHFSKKEFRDFINKVFENIFLPEL